MTEVNVVFPKSELGKEDYRVPLGVCYLSSSLKKSGYSVKCQDLSFEQLDLNCKYLGVSVPTFCFQEAVGIAKKAKEKGVITIAGGMHASIDAESLLTNGFDYVVIGDGEAALPKLLENLEKNGKNERIVDRIKDLDSLSFPDFSWVNWSNYVQNTVPMATSRDCPFSCSFCFRPTRVWRARSPENIIEELALYNGKVVEIVDDVFTLRKDRILALRDLLRKERIDVTFSLMNGVRVDSLSHDMIHLLRDMNTKNINIGAESIHDDVLALCKKGITFQQTKKVVKLLKKHEYKDSSAIYMIVGLPGDTLEKSLASISWVQKTGVKSSWCLATPFPKTEMYNWINKNARWLVSPEDYANYCGLYSRLRVMFETDDFTEQERLYAILKAKYEVERK